MGEQTVVALKSTIFKAELNVADVTRGYYADHSLTIARHPSETDERMMIRVLAFALHAEERLRFGKGLSDVEEPDLLLEDLTGSIEKWIEVGQPDARAILKACGKARQVSVFAYSSSANLWWQGVAKDLERARNLQVFAIPAAQTAQLASLAGRTMQLQCTIQEGSILLSNAQTHLEVGVEQWR